MKFLRKIFLLFIIVIGILIGSLYYYGKNLYFETIRSESISSKISQIKNGSSYITLDNVPSYYKNAVVAVEDKRFYKHGALDIIALVRATITNLKQKDLKEGGSTLTQQTAKNLYFIKETDSFTRKIAEYFVAKDLENNYSKDEILELYINIIYFGDGYYGIKAASNGYLNKEPSELTISEATMLAGIPNAPSVYAPTKNINLTQSRQKKVINSMVESKYISQSEADSIELYSLN